MAILGSILKRTISLNKKLPKLRRRTAYLQQVKTLKKLLSKAEFTAFGEHYHFTKMLAESDPVNTFRSTIETHDYNTMFRKWWYRTLNGEAYVCWPEKVKYFALSSGTSEQSSKHIPVTKDMLKAIKRASIRQILMAPEDRPLTYADKLGYFEGILESMWDFRFLHRDLEQILAGSEELRRHYQDFARLVMVQGKRIYERLAESGLVEAEADAIEALIVNIWVVTSSWISFLHTSGLFGEAGVINRDLLRRGIYQIVQLEAPYLRGEARDKLPELKQRYGDPATLGDHDRRRA